MAHSSNHSAAGKSQSVLGSIALALVIIGAINWGLVGLFNFNAVEALLGTGTLTQIIYVLVGLSGLYALTLYPRVARSPHRDDTQVEYRTPTGYGPGHPDFVERRRNPQPAMSR